MINIKSEREIGLMKTAGRITAKVLKALEEAIKPGVTTLALDALAEDIILKSDAKPAFKGYRGYGYTICASVNEVVIHGIPSSKTILKEGDIISIDVGVNYKGYHGDSAKTFAVGSISDNDKLLIERTETALYKGLSVIQAGKTVYEISKAIEDYIKVFNYGIVEMFTGHGVGKNLHEDPMIPNFTKESEHIVLESGMTLAIEPMVNIGTKDVLILKDGWTCITKDRKKSAHFEHSVVVTESGYEILTDNT